MTCDPLAYTGGGRLELLITIVFCLSRRRWAAPLDDPPTGQGGHGGIAALVCGAAVSMTGGTTGAMAADCPPAANSLPAADPLSPAAPRTPPNPSRPPKPQSAGEPRSAANSLTVSQTSVMKGLAPGIAPVAIAGVVTNNGADSTDIIAVDVEITGVVTLPVRCPGLRSERLCPAGHANAGRPDP